MAEPAKGALALEPGTHHAGAALAPAPPVPWQHRTQWLNTTTQNHREQESAASSKSSQSGRGDQRQEQAQNNHAKPQHCFGKARKQALS